MPQLPITAIGLGLDIIGAILITIPDAQTLFSRLPAGALREARNRMTLIGTQKGDTGFGSLKKALIGIEPIADFGANHDEKEYVEIVVNSLSGMQSAEAAEHPEFKWGTSYVEARYEKDGEWDKTDFYDVEDVFDAIAARERPQTAQLRLYGLLVLICGFSFQFISTIGANTKMAGLVGVLIILACLIIFTHRGRLE